MQKRFRRSVEALGEIFGLIEEYFEAEGIERAYLFAVSLATEEVFTNMVKYGQGSQDILVDLQRSDNQIAVSLTDFEVGPFDMNRVGEARVDLPLEERQPGGLGIHLIRKMVDRIDYEYAGGRSKTTLIKTLE